MRRIFGLTWVGWLNVLALQWLCVRLAYQVDTGGRPIRWNLLVGVVPLTGWRSPYRYLRRRLI